MKIVCIHCGGQFSITGEQLGAKGRCPHCQGEVSLPKAAPVVGQAPLVRHAPTNWLDGSISGLASLVIHMALVLVIALMQPDVQSDGAGMGEEVVIGLLPVEHLTDQAVEQFAAEDIKSDKKVSEELEVEVERPATTAGEATPGGEVAVGSPSASGSVGDAAFDLGVVSVGGGGSGGGGSWDGMIQSLRRNGLDIVICFDSTGSMTGELDQVKRQIDRIGATLFKLVPKTRISVCTYRDTDDEYVVKGTALTGNIQDIKTFLQRTEAGGGGDHPEAVDEGLYWAVMKNQFRPQARKVILIFGDAPPHTENMKRCLETASGFRKQQKGVVSTVTCRAGSPLPEFYEIAAAGGGEAFLTKNQREIMTQLMVLVFGGKHREKVVEAFKLLEN